MNTNKFFAVKDGAKRKILGLWQRNDSFYIQIRVLDAATGVKKAKRIRLEKATTIEEAKMAMLALKQSVRRGETVSGASGPSFKEFSKHYAGRRRVGRARHERAARPSHAATVKAGSGGIRRGGGRGF